MIKFTEFTLQRGHKFLFQNADFIIHKNQRVGIVGANGCGKSSLFSVILDQLHLDGGEFSIPKELTISHVKQETPALDESAIEYVQMGHQQWYQITQSIKQAEASEDHEKLSHLYADFESIHGYEVNANAAKLLAGLGFSETEQQKPVKTFSGGWRMRLNLAQALISPSDILLLDEPTNHLDIETVIWLESWLKNYDGTLLLISHDRDFLDSICNCILHIDNQQVKTYSGNYSFFERARYEQQVLQNQQFEKQQQQVKQLESFIDRFRAKATKAKQVQSRIKSLERMTQIASVQLSSPFTFKFKPLTKKLSNPLIKLEEVGFAYEADKAIFNQLNFTLSTGDRVGLLGYNGSGKSSFIKLLTKQLKVNSGIVNINPKLKIAYFAQHQLEQLNTEQTPYEFIYQIDKKASEQQIRDFLGSFAFMSGQLDNKADCLIKHFSGGEKARLVLSSLVYQQPDLLLLDEPTNHLDLEMRNALAFALQQFEGALIVIAHDRYLLNSITNRFYLVENHNIREFDGDLTDYNQYLSQQKKLAQSIEPSDSKENGTDRSSVDKNPQRLDKKAQRQQDAIRRQQLQPLQKKLKSIEKSMHRYQSELEEVEPQLLDNDIYQANNKDKLKSLLQLQSTAKSKLESLEEQWLDISEQIENF
ncbi:MAG: ATP-binding cassette domain-containing protein [Gammaproteobacteria bacterium]|nr:ATP-binding cassette domain-containing protein [Gammaproteobacteria bacterium]